MVGNGTARSCTSAAVVAAVRAGGAIRLACGPRPVTITLRETAKVRNTRRTVTLDGGGGGAILFVSNDRIAGSRLEGNPSEGFETRRLPGLFFLGAGPPAITRSTLRQASGGLSSTVGM